MIKKYFDLESLLLALIICINVIKFFLNNFDTNVAYILYGAFIIVSLYNKHKNKAKMYNSFNNLFFWGTMMLFIIFTFLYSFELSTQIMALKFLIIFLTMYCVSFVNINKVQKVLFYIIIIVLIYSLYILSHFDNSFLFMLSTNYLTVTFPIGLSLSISLVYLIINIYENKKINSILLAIVSVIYFFVLIKFSARGSIIFPILVLLFYILLLKKNPIKYMRVLLIVILVAFVGYNLYMNNVSEYDLSRMNRLFTNNSSESRWPLWHSYIDHCLNEGWFITGGGTYSSEKILGYYPHNLYMQICGEFGIIGIITCLIVTFIVIKEQVLAYLFSLKEKEFSNITTIFYLISGGLLYLFLVYMKSSSIYDSGVFFIFVSLALNCSSVVKNSKEKDI